MHLLYQSPAPHSLKVGAFFGSICLTLAHFNHIGGSMNGKRGFHFVAVLVALGFALHILTPFMAQGMVSLFYVDAAQEALPNPGDRTFARTVDARACRQDVGMYAPKTGMAMVGSAWCYADTPVLVKGILVGEKPYYLYSNFSRDSRGLFWRVLYLKFCRADVGFAPSTDIYNNPQDSDLSVGLYIGEGAPSLAWITSLEKLLYILGF